MQICFTVLEFSQVENNTRSIQFSLSTVYCSYKPALGTRACNQCWETACDKLYVMRFWWMLLGLTLTLQGFMVSLHNIFDVFSLLEGVMSYQAGKIWHQLKMCRHLVRNITIWLAVDGVHNRNHIYRWKGVQEFIQVTGAHGV